MGSAMTAPLRNLTKTAEDLAAGNLAARASIESRDEIGTLAKTLNSMAVSLSSSIYSLEQRVAERTTDLENARLLSEKRVIELQAIGEISSIIAGEQQIETLLPLITRLVSERFDFYHVGIFLLDETKQFAVLQAANSEGGQKMLERRHMLEVGTTGIVGYVAQKGESRIALDVGTDGVFFNNPDLPQTRSEMALPLIARGQIIGVLDVQSDKPGAFTDVDAKTLSILGDQIAIAIENARLLDQTQRALREMQALYSQHVLENWRNFTEEETAVGYQQSLTGGHRLDATVDSEEIRTAMNRGSVLVFQADGDEAEPQIVVPVKLRGQVIGVIKIKAPAKDRHWSPDEINLAEAISDRLSLALENARLIQDSQRQAIKEQAISEVTAKISSSINLRNVLQSAVEELGRTIPGSEVEIRFQSNGDH
jgi:GAF domain-containing protein